MPDYKAFRVELADKIAHVQINRPEKINAMNADFWKEIVEIFREIEDNDEVRVVVLSGAGKHFSSGIDLMMLASVGAQLGPDAGRNARALRRKILELQASFNAVDNCSKPVIAAIQGYCLGGAIDLISACDMRYSTGDAQFSIKEIDIGMAADVRDYAAVEQALRQAADRFGKIDIVLSGAAGNFVAPALGMSANGFKTVVDIDLIGTFNVLRASFEFLNRPGASLISITAGQGARPSMFQAHVCAAKAGINMLTKCLAMEWGPAGVRVNAISPGPISADDFLL